MTHVLLFVFVVRWPGDSEWGLDASALRFQLSTRTSGTKLSEKTGADL